MRKKYPIIAAAAILAVLATVSFFPSISPVGVHSTQTTPVLHSPQTFIQKGMFVTIGIDSYNLYGTKYQLVTMLRSVSTSLVISIRASLRLNSTGPSINVTTFAVGIAVIGPHTPLPYNATANAADTQLIPPKGSTFQLGESFPETLDVTFQNGTNTQMQFYAQVFSE